MGIVRDFEKRLEGLFEGAFSRLFKVGVHPVEIAKRITREAEAGKQVSTGGVIIPNLYEISLSTPDFERISQFRESLLPELEKLVLDLARRNGYTFLSRPNILLASRENLPEGRFEVEARVTSPGGATAPTPAPRGRVPAGIRLTVDGGPLKGLTLEAKDFPVRLGRAEDNDLVLEDPRVSRHHALIRTQGELFILEDLGSTNGTFFGGRRVGARVLDDGDRFNIGGSEILFSLA
jgi:hypothetical protein